MSDPTEVWQRGPIAGIAPLLMPVAHALVQAREDIQYLAANVPDAIVWEKPNGAASIGFHVPHLGGALDRLFTYARGEMLNDALTAPAPRSPAVTLGYRHYEIATDTTPEFAAILGLVPRGSVDEISTALSVASPQGRVGMEVRGGVGRDRARQAHMWRAEGALIWAPARSVRFELGYEQATDFTTGLVGERHAARLSCHVDF